MGKRLKIIINQLNLIIRSILASVLNKRKIIIIKIFVVIPTHIY